MLMSLFEKKYYVYVCYDPKNTVLRVEHLE